MSRQDTFTKVPLTNSIQQKSGKFTELQKQFDSQGQLKSKGLYSPVNQTSKLAKAGTKTDQSAYTNTRSDQVGSEKSKDVKADGKQRAPTSNKGSSDARATTLVQFNIGSALQRRPSQEEGRKKQESEGISSRNTGQIGTRPSTANQTKQAAKDGNG